MAAKQFVIGSRGSDLALWQAKYVKAQIEHLGYEVVIKIIKTKGDNIQHLSFDKMEGKGFFTKEIEEALLKKEIDIAVHSHKDLETTSPEGLVIAAVSEREAPNDLLLINKEFVTPSLEFNLKPNAVVGTSSARRKAQILALRPDIKIEDIRGNVPTRIQKLRDRKFNAILLAKAGVKRLGLNLDEFETVELPCTHFIPAPAQGVLAIQCRSSATELIDILKKINNVETENVIAYERGIMKSHGGGCQTPIGIYCEQGQNNYIVRTSVAKSWDAFPRRACIYTPLYSDLESIVQKSIAAIENPKPMRVFITRKLEENSFFKRYFNVAPYSLVDNSLIAFEAVNFSAPPNVNWIFFSSRRAVSYFLKHVQGNYLKDKKIACVGMATAKEVLKFNIQPDFIGDSNDLTKVGKSFFSLAHKGSILFPQSNQSVQSIQNVLDKTKAFEIHNLVVYNTQRIENGLIPECDAYVFTSPSNVEAFLSKQAFPTNSRIVAIGETTRAKLMALGQKNIIVSPGYSEIDLVDAVISEGIAHS